MDIPRERVIGSLTYELIRPPERRFTFTTDLLKADHRRIVVAGEVSPSKPLFFGGEEVIGSRYWAVWFLFKGEPWDVGRFYRPDGTFTGYYADVLNPVDWDGEDPASLQPLVDLFLDIWVAPDETYQVLDEDEFEEAVRSNAISSDRAAHATAVLSNLVDAVDRKQFPPQEVRDFRL